MGSEELESVVVIVVGIVCDEGGVVGVVVYLENCCGMLEGVGEVCMGDGVFYASGPNAVVLGDSLGEGCFILCDVVGWGCGVGGLRIGIG